MEKQVVYINAKREGYAVDQILSTMTVRELIDYLEQFEDESKVYISNDNGYTYGSIHMGDINEDWVDDEEDYDEDENNEQ